MISPIVSKSISFYPFHLILSNKIEKNERQKRENCLKNSFSEGIFSSRNRPAKLPLLSNLVDSSSPIPLENEKPRNPPSSVKSRELVEARGDEASNFTGVRQLGQVIIFTGSGTRPTTSKLEPFFPVPRTARILCTSAAQDQACVQTRDAGSRLHGYVHPPLSLATPAGSADVARSRRCRLSSLCTGAAPGRLPCGADGFVPVDPGRVILSFFSRQIPFTDRGVDRW